MTQVANKNDKYVVRLSASNRPVFIESQEQWKEFERVGKYIGLLKSAKTDGTNKIRVSSIIAYSQEHR